MRHNLERPQLRHYVALHADSFLWYLLFLTGREEHVPFQLHFGGGILLDLPLHLALEQLRIDVVSGRGESGKTTSAYRPVGMIQEIL